MTIANVRKPAGAASEVKVDRTQAGPGSLTAGEKAGGRYLACVGSEVCRAPCG